MAQRYGLTPDRYVEVSAELARIEEYLTALAGELQQAAAPTAKHGHTWQMCQQASRSVRLLAHALGEGQRWTS